jgi:SAM-dependent methyltransferase
VAARVPVSGSARRPPPYLAGPLRASFDAWLDETVARHSTELSFREIRKGVQALTQLYVERRAGADLAARALEGRGKRAALATYYAPLHFLVVHHVLAALGPGRLGAVDPVVDLGCGTGASGAAAAATLGGHPRVTAVDRSGFVLGEARRTDAAFGLTVRTVRGRLPGALPRPAPGALWVLAWAVNELEPGAREALLPALVGGLERGVRLLILEPLAGPASPWWAAWRRALAPLGVEEPRFKLRVALPEWIARLDRAAGLDHRVLGARVLVGPLEAGPEERAERNGDPDEPDRVARIREARVGGGGATRDRRT